MVYLPIDIVQNFVLLRKWAFLREFYCFVGFFLGFHVDVLNLLFGENSLLGQAAAPDSERIVIGLIFLDFFRRPILLGVGIGDRMSVVTVSLDLEDSRLRMIVSPVQGELRFGPYFVDILPVENIPSHVITFGSLG